MTELVLIIPWRHRAKLFHTFVERSLPHAIESFIYSSDTVLEALKVLIMLFVTVQNFAYYITCKHQSS